MIKNTDDLAVRERERNAHEKEMFNLQAAHVKEVRTMELEIARLEATWTSWLKIPITIVKLPVYVVFGIAYCIAVARKHEPGENFWSFFK